MQSTQALALLAGVAGLAAAAPAAVGTRQFRAQLHLNGAAATYTVSAPADATLFYTGNSLAVDQVCLDGGATCTLHGVDGASVTVVGAHCVAVGPPQAIVSGSCLAL